MYAFLPFSCKRILTISGNNQQLNITSKNIQGLVVGAPYLACALIGCWLTEPLNRLFARRGTIFISCVVAAVASIWEGVANTWVNLFIARFVLGLGIGSKSSTVPVYAAGEYCRRELLLYVPLLTA
jgi:MFS family permease